MKKKALLGGALALTLLTATGCKDDNQQTGWADSDLNGKTLNVYINYKGTMGVTYTGKVTKLGETYTNPIDGVTYTNGTLLPTWKQVQENLGVTIHDAVRDFKSDAYTQISDDAVYEAIKDDSNLSNIDVLMTNSKNANNLSGNGKLVDLSKYLDVMPNLKAWLDAHPNVKDELTDGDGNMYMAPYFDGVDTIERMFLFNTELVEKLLDSDTGTYDTTAVDAAKAARYTPFIKTDADYLINVSKNGQLQDMTVKASKNPVQRQNELTTKNGQTYVQALKAHIDQAYGEYIGTGKLYSKRSEVFTSESACYNTDDMIALMRCAVNNPHYLLGEYDDYDAAKSTIQGIVPRGEANNRVISILQMAQIWGVRGLTAETDYLYFDKDGNLQDARVTEATYDALDKLNALKQEGLIIDGWDQVPTSGASGTKYYSYLLGSNNGAACATLMMYDYNATQAVNNKLDSATGIGSSNAKFNGIRPVLPPVTTWVDDDISNSKYEYTRYTEDSRAFKGAGSVVLAKDDENRIKAACKLIDYFYGEEGADLQDYGPAAYQDGTITVAGVTYPKIKPAVMTAINASGLGWNDYYRAVIGSTQGMGHIRSDGLDYQVTHPSGQVGLSNVLNAIKSGALICATTARERGFGATVPAKWDSNPTTTTITTLIDFWKQGGNNTHWRRVINDGWADGQRASLKEFWTQSNDVYLAHYRRLLGMN